MKKALSLILTVLMVAGVFTMFAVTSYADDTIIEPYENGMENWTGSPNKGDAAAATQILICPSPWDGDYYKDGFEMKITMKAVDGSSEDTFTAQAATTYNGGTWGICRYEPCLMKKPWVPEKDKHYYVTASFTDVNGKKVTVQATTVVEKEDGTKETVPAEYFLNVDPIVPGKTPDKTGPETLTLAPAYGVIENWGDPIATYFIVGGTNKNYADREKLAPAEGKATLFMKVVIVDETAKKTYTIDKYAFDNPGKEIYGDGSFVRVAVCDYGIVPVKDHQYTVYLAFYTSKGIQAEGTSAVGAFTGGNDAFQADGAIVPETVPHKATVKDGTKVDDNTPKPPKAGEATTIVIVLGTLALIGTAVVVTKKVFVK